MTEIGSVILSEKSFPWDITIYKNEITLCSNNFYLDYLDNENEKVKGSPYMSYWNFEIDDNNHYYFISKSKNGNSYNKILSIEGKEIKVNKNEARENELFELIDVIEE